MCNFFHRKNSLFKTDCCWRTIYWNFETAIHWLSQLFLWSWYSLSLFFIALLSTNLSGLHLTFYQQRDDSNAISFLNFEMLCRPKLNDSVGLKKELDFENKLSILSSCPKSWNGNFHSIGKQYPAQLLTSVLDCYSCALLFFPLLKPFKLSMLLVQFDRQWQLC